MVVTTTYEKAQAARSPHLTKFAKPQVDYPQIGVDYIAKYYRPYLMEDVYRKRVQQGLVRERGDIHWYGATAYEENIGLVMVVRFRSPATGLLGPFEKVLIVDCSAPRDRQRHIDERLGLEVSYAMADKYGFVDEGRATFQVQRWER